VPARVAWIETQSRPQHNSVAQSLPARVAWIETQSRPQHNSVAQSLPARVAWIEMPSRRAFAPRSQVPLLTSPIGFQRPPHAPARYPLYLGPGSGPPRSIMFEAVPWIAARPGYRRPASVPSPSRKGSLSPRLERL
jgi:hypothetical protein